MSESLILRTMAPWVLAAAIALSLFLLLRGHNEPGGGFIGGLVAALGFIFHAMALGASATRRRLPGAPLAIAGTGLAVAALSGLPALLGAAAPFLTHLWIAGTHLGTALVFDIGVYLVVIGFALGFVLPFLEDRPC